MNTSAASSPVNMDYRNSEAAAWGKGGPQVACNFEDARNFVVVCRVDRVTTVSEVSEWVLWALGQSAHTAAFDTYNRTRSAWAVRFVRETSCEIRALVSLEWDGRRYVDLDALTFVRDTPRDPPLMNASEIFWLLQDSDVPPFLRSMGVSGVRSTIMDELLEDVSPRETVYRMDEHWHWRGENKSHHHHHRAGSAAA